MPLIASKERYAVVPAVLILAACIGVAIAFFAMLEAGQKLTEVANRRLESYRLASELRQSSDDLTRFVRTYVVTGDIRYRQYYDAVLAIRNGELPRPQNYYRIYWDLVAADNAALNTSPEMSEKEIFHTLIKPRPDSAPVPLQTLMRQAGFSNAEFAKLREAQAQSDALVQLEIKAMNAVVGRFADAQGNYSIGGPPDLDLARSLMHGTAYHAAKRAIMQPIDDFFVLLESRTTSEVKIAEAHLQWAQFGFIAMVMLLAATAGAMIWQARQRTLTQLGTTPEHLEQVIGEIAAGNLDESLQAPADSMLAKVNMTANRLRELIQDKQQLEQQVNVTSEELRLVMTQLVQSETLSSLGGLVAGIAHELNTPLGSATTMVSTLAERVDELKRAYDSNAMKKSMLASFVAESGNACTILERNIRRAAELVKSFKQVAVDQASTRRRQFKLKTLAEETLQTLQPLLKNNPVSIRIDIPDHLQFDSYPGPLEQVFTNLIHNAITHALGDRAQMSIVISAERVNAEYARIVFRDDGNGMSADVVKHAFDPFFTTKIGKGGSGLGLFLVHKLIHGTLGGSIELQSTIGDGTRFDINLPFIAPVAADEPAATATLIKAI